MRSKAGKNRLNLLHRTKKWIFSEEMVNSQESTKSVWKKVSLRWEGFVKDLGLEPAVKE